MNLRFRGTQRKRATNTSNSWGYWDRYPRKGIFYSHNRGESAFKIFLLFNKLSAHKKIVYDTFVKTLEGIASVDFYIYHNDFTLFKRLIQNSKNDYTHYVIVPHFWKAGKHANEIINQIPADKLLILDKKDQRNQWALCRSV